MRNNDKSLNRPVLFILNDIWSSLNLKRKTQAVLIFCLMISSSIAEIASLGLIFPYLSYLQGKDNESKILKYLNIDNSQNILLYITIFLIAIILIAGFLRVLNLYFNYS